MTIIQRLSLLLGYSVDDVVSMGKRLEHDDKNA